MYSATVHALADATAAPVPASGNSPVPIDWLGRPLACDKFLPSNVWRPNGDRATLISVHITAQGELRHAVLFKSSGDGNLDAAALACVPTLHLSVTQNGAPADIVWVVGVYWHTNWSNFRVPILVPAPSPDISYHAPNLARVEYYCWYMDLKSVPKIDAATALKFHIDEHGAVTDVQIAKSSGDARLDAHTADCVAHWHFCPAEQNGHPVQIDWGSEFDWKRVRGAIIPQIDD